MARVVLDPDELYALLKSSRGPTAQYLVQKSQHVVNGARDRCPVDTGNLRGSIQYEIAEDKNGLSARVGTNVPYAIYVHEGSRGRKGTPFLRDALDAVQF